MCVQEINRSGTLADLGSQGLYTLKFNILVEFQCLLYYILCLQIKEYILNFSVSSAISQSSGGDRIQLPGHGGCCFCLFVYRKSVPVH